MYGFKLEKDTEVVVSIIRNNPSVIGLIRKEVEGVVSQQVTVHLEPGFNNTYRGVILDEDGKVMHSMAAIEAEDYTFALYEMAQTHEFLLALKNAPLLIE